MSYGLPVVTTPVGAIPEVVVDGVNGFLIKPGSIKELHQKIIQLSENSGLRRKMGKKNRELIESRYSKTTMIKNIDRIYKSLI